MNRIIKIFQNASFKQANGFNILFLLFLFILMHAELESQPQYQTLPQLPTARTTQIRPDLRANMHIIRDTVSAVKIQLVEDDQIKEVERPLSAFQLQNSENMAIVKEREEPRSFESRGKVLRDGSQESLKGLMLPEIYITRIKPSEMAPSYPGGPPSAPEQVILQVLVDTMPRLKFNRISNSFEGSFSVALLDDSEILLSSKELETPVSLQFSSPIGEFVPNSIKIQHTNHFNQIQIIDRSPDNPVPVKIMPVFNMQGYVTYLAKQPVIRIETPSRSIQGYGVQSVPVEVSLNAYTGLDSVRVTLATDLGSVDPDNIYLTRDKSKVVMLKSEGTGQAILSATSYGFSGDEREFMFIFPLMFIVLSVIGGLTGASVKFLMKKEKGKLLSVLLLGCLTGFIVALLYWGLGVKVFNIEFDRIYNEGAVLGLAILGALFWEPIYSFLAKFIVK